MKLRLRGHSLRLRLSRGEVERLKETGQVVEQTGLADRACLEYRLVIDASVAEPSASLAGSAIHVALPQEVALAWAGSDEVGIEAWQPLADGERLRILIEKDFACLAERPGEDDSDAFPHPQAGRETC